MYGPRPPEPPAAPMPGGPEALRPKAGYCVARPTIWQRLGFGFARAPRPDEDEFAEGWAPSWFVVETFGKFDWRDRLRVLFSGNLHVQVAVKTDVPIGRARSTGAIAVPGPGQMPPRPEAA